MFKINPIQYSKYFFLPFAIFAVGIIHLFLQHWMSALIYTFVSVLFIVFQTMNMAFGKKIQTLCTTVQPKHIFERNSKDMKYVNGILLSSGYSYSHTVEQTIEKIVINGKFWGSFEIEHIVDEKRVFMKELKNNYM